MSSSYRIELDKWLAGLEVQALDVIDIGGSQLPVKGRTKTWEVGNYIIADMPEPHVGSPKPDLEIDLNKWNPGLSGYKGVYELIFCLEVFDYVYDPINALKIIKDLMKAHARAYISFPSQYPLHQPVEDDALRYMPGGIRKMAEKVGLEVRQMIPRRTETNAIYEAFRAERMRCAKGEDHGISGWIVEMER